MASNIECVGFEGTEAGLMQAIAKALEDGNPADAGDGLEWWLWHDPSGAGMSVYTSGDREVVCATPTFEATSTLEIRSGDVGRDPSCDFCSVLHVEVVAGGELQYPLAVQLEEIGDVLRHGATATAASIAAFAGTVQTWPDEAAYLDGQGEEPHFAPESLIPIGLFVEKPRRGLFRRARQATPAATALITGRVRSAESRLNTLTGLEFTCARVATFGGDYDVVGAAGELPASTAEGAIVQVEAWLMGRLRA